MLIEITVEGHRLSSLFVSGSMECGLSYELWSMAHMGVQG